MVNEWKEKNKGKEEIDYLESITEGEQLDAGDYIVGERVVTVAKDGSMSYFY